MNARVKIGLYVVLILSAIVFGQRFYVEYSSTVERRAAAAEGTGNLEEVRLPDYQASPGAPTPPGRESAFGAYAFAFLATVVAFGLLLGRDLSQYFGGRALKLLFNDEGAGIGDPAYDKAEEEWAKGRYLPAIELLREYLTRNPSEIHASIRIAEIYEKDLQNFLAAALEYEEVLKHKFNPERWGWAAIHLCNLYSSKLHQPDKAVALLRQLNQEHPQTAAARKARKRLAEIDGVPYEEDEDAIQAPATAASGAEAETQADSPAVHLPPGFRIKK